MKANNKLTQANTEYAIAAVMRNGLIEMKNFCMEFFESAKAETFFQESAGVADLMTSCMSCNSRLLMAATDVKASIFRHGRSKSKVCRGM